MTLTLTSCELDGHTGFRATIERLLADPSQPDVTLRQLAVMLFARDNLPEHCTVRAIAGRLNGNRPGITRAADRLAQLGLLKREPDPSDRRSVLLALTPRGKAFAETLPGASS